MNWCVCSTRDGKLSLLTRVEREMMLKVLMSLKKEIPTHVIKTFESKSDAEKYILEINRVNKLIKNL